MSQSARNLVAAILNNEELINTLANACSAQDNTINPTQYRTADDEIYSMFNRGRPNVASLTSQTVPSHQASSSNVIERTLTLASAGPEPSTSSRVYNLRPYSRYGPRQTRFHSVSHSTAQSFTKEVVLLPDHTFTHVPRRATKAWLFEYGHIKSAVEFNCLWDANKVMQTIKEAFQPAADGCRLQILLSCYNKLVEPSLSSKQSLTGGLVKKLFHQKSIYVRPDKVILTEEKELSCVDEDHTNSSDLPEISDEISDASQSLSSGDQVIWCVATEAVCSDAAAISNDTHIMSSCADVIIIDDTHTSSKTSTTSSGNTDSSMGQSVVSSSVSASNPSVVSTGPTFPIFDGASSALSSVSSNTPYSTYLDLFEEQYLSDDPDIKEAISRSFSDNTNESNSTRTLEEILEQIASRVNNDTAVRFNIVRKNVWDGASRAMRRANFSPEKKIDIKFMDDYGISEGAVDSGGPTREFFRLCLHEIKDNIGIFEGPPNAKVLTCNSRAMKDSGYFHAGQIMAMSIAHGGQNPCFLSDVMYQCLQKGPDNVQVKPEQICDDETRSKVQSIVEAKTESELQEAVAGAATLISLAGHNVHITLKNKDETALDLTRWCVLHRTRAPFERFSDGLRSLGVLDALQRYPLQMKCLFVKAEKALTPTDVENLFQIIHSERGSNWFQQECSTLAFWQDYLQDAAIEKDVPLEEILVFFTGCDSIPALGFSPKPSLEFVHHSRFPEANTCENVLRIPIHVAYTTFKSDMSFAIRNSPGFGRA